MATSPDFPDLLTSLPTPFLSPHCYTQYVYEFLLRFVVSNETDPKVVKKYISQDFLVKLLDLFDSEDPRERDYLKTILHRIYGKFMPYRAFIRKAINNIFYRFIYETERHNGAPPPQPTTPTRACADAADLYAPCLPFHICRVPYSVDGRDCRLQRRYRGASRDSWFHHQRFRAAFKRGAQTVPHEGIAAAAQGPPCIDVPSAAVLLRDTVRRERSKARGAGPFVHPTVLAQDFLREGGTLSQRGACFPDPRVPSTEFLTKAPTAKLLKRQVEEILEMVQAQEFQLIMSPLFAQVAKCVGSPHFQVAERALFLWNNEYIVSLIAQQRDQILPLVFEALYTNSRSHWNSTVHGLTCNVVKLFMEMDSKLFDDCSAEYRDMQEREAGIWKQKEEMWNTIEKDAEGNEIYEHVKDVLKPKASLAYAMRASQIKQGLTMFEEHLATGEALASAEENVLQAKRVQSLTRPADREREAASAQSAAAQAGLVKQFGQRRKSAIPRKAA